MWVKIKSWFGNSVTVFLSAATGVISLVLENIELIAGKNFKEQLLEAGFDTTTAGRVGLVLSVLMFLARMRSLRKSQ